MKNIFVPLTILVLLLIGFPISALALNPISKVTASQTLNSGIVGTQIGEQTFKPTQVAGSASSDQSNQGQTVSGSDQGQKGSENQDMGQNFWKATSIYPGPVQTYPISGNNLWISTPQGFMTYAAVPQYSSVSLVASTSIGGQAVVYELYPITTNQNVYTASPYSFIPGDNQMGFVANIVGRHILLFSIGNLISNGVIIDVQNANPIPQQSMGGLLGQGASF